MCGRSFNWLVWATYRNYPNRQGRWLWFQTTYWEIVDGKRAYYIEDGTQY